MRYRVNAGYVCPDNPGDIRDRVRELASRKVSRFLDAASFAPFLAAASVYRRDPVAPPEDVALYTVGGWDGNMPDQPSLSDGSMASDAELSRHILEQANPVEWLRMLSNNSLCQVSIAEGFRGPNAHLVGGPDALGQVLAIAAADLRRGATRQALLVAYDTAPADRLNPSGRALTSAAALSLAPLADDVDAEDALPRLFEAATKAEMSGDSALDVLRACLAETVDVR